MSRVIERRWEADFTALSRRDRRPCYYKAYVPDPLTGRIFTLDGDVAADVTMAEAAIARLDTDAVALADMEALARLLLRAESIASSRIEGLEIGARRLLRVEAASSTGEPTTDVTASEILGNIHAMADAIGEMGVGEPITVDRLLRFHHRLLVNTRLSEHAGRIRTEQNWIGGNGHTPCSADFVPPPPEFVEELLEDLCAFCSDDSLPAVAQAAIAHAQFETIHPFVDGNGRTGRALIQLVLRSRGLAVRVLPPVSLVLATRAADYIDGLGRTRYAGPSDSPAAHEGVNQWVGRFAGACSRAVDDAHAYERRGREIEQEWRSRLGTIRAKSATDLLVGKLVRAPMTTVNGAAALIERSFPQTNQAIKRLTEAGILQQITIGRRNRAFEAQEVISAFPTLW